MAHKVPIIPVLLMIIVTGCGSTLDVLPVDWAKAQLNQSEDAPGTLEMPEGPPDLPDGDMPPPNIEMLVATSSMQTREGTPNTSEAPQVDPGLGLESDSLPPVVQEPAQVGLGSEFQLLSGIQVYRQNPFNFAEGYSFDDMQNLETNGQQKLKLYGFVGKPTPRVILRVGEVTKILARGEKWLTIEVLEVSPPSVKLRANGILKELSLLDEESRDTQKDS